MAAKLLVDRAQTPDSNAAVTVWPSQGRRQALLFSSRRRHTRSKRDWSSDVCSSDLAVVAANRSSIPEVVGDAALLFDPDSADELTEALILLARDPSARESLAARGRERARLFSWEDTDRKSGVEGKSGGLGGGRSS